ncbi:hypothetical protein EG832_00740 [bacterium]|nr:hypothetical protein [bacterium]
MPDQIQVARVDNPSNGCHAGCIIKCSQIYGDEKGEYETSGFEYETIWEFGCAGNITDLDDIARCGTI